MGANDETVTGSGVTQSIELSLTSSSIQNPKSLDSTRSPGLDTVKLEAAEVLLNDKEKDSFIEPATSRASVPPVDLVEAEATPTQSNTKIKIRKPRSVSALSVPGPDETFPLQSSKVTNYKTFSMSSRRSRGSWNAPSRAGNETAETEAVTPTCSPTKRLKIPQLSTLKLKTKNLYAELGYTSRDFWEASDDEFEETKGTPARASDTLFQSVNRNASLVNDVSPVPSLRQSPSTPADEETQTIPVAQFQALKLLPGQKIRKSMTSKFNASLTPSVRRSLLLSAECSPTNSKAIEPKMSIWDADDEEFNRWPGQETLDRIGKDYTIRNRQMRALPSTSHSADTTVPTFTSEDANPIPQVCIPNLTLQQIEDLKHELLDRNSGNPQSSDAHDLVMSHFYSNDLSDLPASNPPRHMHLLAQDAYMNSRDTIVRCAMPRLCDAVATVLYLTSLKCLEEFLNPYVKVFEWRRSGNGVMIRREASRVVVGTYANFGTMYVWTYFVCADISDSGLWTETYASVSRVVMPVSKDGVRFDQAETEPSSLGIKPTDPKYALSMGRELAYFLLSREPWRFQDFRRWVVEWEVDGVVTEALAHEKKMLLQQRQG